MYKQFIYSPNSDVRTEGGGSAIVPHFLEFSLKLVEKFL